MMKWANDKDFLQRLNDALGGEEAIRAAAGGIAPPEAQEPPAPTPEVETLDDARYGTGDDRWKISSPSARTSTRAIRRPEPRSTTPSRSVRATRARKFLTCCSKPGADLTATDEKKNTAAPRCVHGKPFAVKALLEKGCDKTATNGTQVRLRSNSSSSNRRTRSTTTPELVAAWRK